MSACAMLSYGNVTASAWQCIKSAAASHGVTINTNSGSVTVSGFTFAWNYNPGASTLSVQCTDSPWFVPCSTINSQLNNAIEGCLTQEKLEQTILVDV
ncbi:hypothetical protein [Sphingomonas sp. CARO-RG-8B-R24-01]|uniref:hypothetical protein n=2 Tax=unclassified Sphingomonas TaxID=196159 RepID=UPI001F5889D6|nr:hypothetical protein [Sphingomonas sp. CARO-RG-8B-R24-01]